MKRILLVSLLLTWMGKTFAQTAKISGRVTSSEDNDGLPGVSVVVKGSSVGAITDVNGHYTIQAAKGQTLIFSYVGMTTVGRVVNTKTINVILKPFSNTLDQMVVIGYGTEKKANTTGSLSSITGDNISSLITPNFATQLGGRAAGVQVSVPNGLLGQSPRILIRGTNSISSGTGPLIVIDNVPVASNPYSGAGPADPLSDINPSDIESYEVLKDGAATAIFGSRAANGVILITTKHGKGHKGKMAVNYDFKYGQNKVVSHLKLLNAADFITIANEKYTNAGQPIQAFADGKGTDTDWQKVIFRKGMVQSHNLSLNGANDKTNYFFSVGYLKNDGSIVANSMTRYNFRANLDHTVNNWLNLGTSLSYTLGEFTNLNTGTKSLSGNVIGAARLLPNVSPYDPANVAFDGYNITPDGAALGQGANLRPVDNNFTNIAFVLSHNKFITNNNRIIGNVYAEANILSGLKFRTQFATDLLSQDDFQSRDSRHGDGRSENGNLFQRFRPVKLWNWQNTLSYNKSLGKNNFNAVAGLEYQKRTSRYIEAEGQGFSELFFLQNNLISGSYTTELSGGGFVQDAFDSYFARVNYNYSGKYFVGLTVRNDGLSSLPLAHRRGTFPGVSLAYRISNESYWKENSLAKYINDIKIRASFAVVGNTNIGSFPYLGTFGAAQYATQTGIEFDNIGNDQLKWEKSTKTNFGVDLGLLNNRFKVTIDYFQNKVSDLVLFAPTANSLGVPDNGINKNIGAMVNKGIEISIDAEILKRGNFRWDMNFNYSKINNKILALNNNEDIIFAYQINRVGYSIGSFYGFTSAGVNPANGNPMWYKGDGNGGLTNNIVQYNIATNSYKEYNPAEPGNVSKASTLSAVNDKTILGNSNPLWMGGWSNSFHFKGFDLDIFSRFQGGNKIMNVTKQETLLNMGFQNNGQIIMNRWTTVGQITDIPKVWIGRDAAINQTGAASTRFLEKGDFFRIQNIVLSYRIPKVALDKFARAAFKSIKVYAQIQNPVVFTKYTGLDPEISSSGVGIDANANPIVRTSSFGLNIGF